MASSADMAAMTIHVGIHDLDQCLQEEHMSELDAHPDNDVHRYADPASISLESAIDIAPSSQHLYFDV